MAEMSSTFKHIDKLKVIDLKAQLQARGLKQSGRKNLLIKRLSKALQDEGENPNDYLFEVTSSELPCMKPKANAVASYNYAAVPANAYAQAAFIPGAQPADGGGNPAAVAESGKSYGSNDYSQNASSYGPAKAAFGGANDKTEVAITSSKVTNEEDGVEEKVAETLDYLNEINILEERCHEYEKHFLKVYNWLSYETTLQNDKLMLTEETSQLTKNEGLDRLNSSRCKALIYENSYPYLCKLAMSYYSENDACLKKYLTNTLLSSSGESLYKELRSLKLSLLQEPGSHLSFSDAPTPSPPSISASSASNNESLSGSPLSFNDVPTASPPSISSSSSNNESLSERERERDLKALSPNEDNTES